MVRPHNAAVTAGVDQRFISRATGVEQDPGGVTAARLPDGGTAGAARTVREPIAT